MVYGSIWVQEYVAALQQFLAHPYEQSSHHVQWAAAFAVALNASDGVLAGSSDGNASADTASVFLRAWRLAPAAGDAPEDVARGHAALQIAAAAAGFTGYRLTGKPAAS